ncbi:MAG: hypothetical protein IPL61_26440 [Myxococcales bacterium]|nr:hypothetical protein [Myxococcales bacterium]
MRAWWLAAGLAITGCSDGGGAIIDAASPDGRADASADGDAAAPDAGTVPDAADLDAGAADATAADATGDDATLVPDAATLPDATLLDATTVPDAALPDATGTDAAALPDATGTDAATLAPDATTAPDAAALCPVGLDALAPASLAITTDDNTKVWLNGVLVDDVARIWSDPQRYDVMIFAHPGHPNVLAIEGINLQNQAGYDRATVADLRFTIDGVPQTVVTDAAFRATNTLTAGWEQPGFDDSAWPAAVTLGQVGIAPWGAVFASLAPGSTAQWIWTYDPAAVAIKPTVESTYARRQFTTVDPRCPVVIGE